MTSEALPTRFPGPASAGRPITWFKALSAAGTALAILLVYLLAVTPAVGQSGAIVRNGTQTGLKTPNAFLFEPEVPFTSLKNVPIWNELEQLLDRLRQHRQFAAHRPIVIANRHDQNIPPAVDRRRQ